MPPAAGGFAQNAHVWILRHERAQSRADQVPPDVDQRGDLQLAPNLAAELLQSTPELIHPLPDLGAVLEHHVPGVGQAHPP